MTIRSLLRSLVVLAAGFGLAAFAISEAGQAIDDAVENLFEGA